MIDTSKVKNSKLRFKWDLPLRDAMIESFDSIVDFAIDRARTAEEDPETAVHEFRKSIRRARSLLRLMADALDDFDRTDINASLREAFEPTSALRDADVLLPVIAMWSRLAPDETTVEAVKDSLIGHRQEVGSHEAVDVLNAQIERLHHCKWLLRKQLPEEVTWKQVQTGLTRSYRRCQKRRHTAATSGEDIAVHDWRKRTKEIRYQTELFASGTNLEPISTCNGELGDLAQALGEATDLQIFSDFLKGLELPGAHAWQQSVHREYWRSLGASVLNSNHLFAQTPKDFGQAMIDGIQEGLTAAEEEE